MSDQNQKKLSRDEMLISGGGRESARQSLKGENIDPYRRIDINGKSLDRKMTADVYSKLTRGHRMVSLKDVKLAKRSGILKKLGFSESGAKRFVELATQKAEKMLRKQLVPKSKGGLDQRSAKIVDSTSIIQESRFVSPKRGGEGSAIDSLGLKAIESSAAGIRSSNKISSASKPSSLIGDPNAKGLTGSGPKTLGGGISSNFRSNNFKL